MAGTWRICSRCGKRFYGSDNICTTCKNSSGKSAGKNGISPVAFVAMGLLGGLIYLIIEYWMYAVSIAVIAAACTLICVFGCLKSRNPKRSIIITILAGICLITVVFFIVPKIQGIKPPDIVF